MNQCAHCGAVFEARKGRGRSQIYCASECRALAVKAYSKERYAGRYVERRRAYGEARYAANREALNEQAKARYRANPEPGRERSRQALAALQGVADTVVQIFEKLPDEQARSDYAEWIMLISSRTPYHRLAGIHRVDDWLARYLAN